MVNIYSELKLDPSASLPELQSELYHQEKVWRKREIYSSEAATAKLALINKAKKIFASSSSRAAYDRELEASRRKPASADPGPESRLQYEKWYSAAKSYMDDQQYDLAKTALEKAIRFINSDNEEAQFYCDAAIIYRECCDVNTAMSYINKAIVIDGENPSFYITKGTIYMAPLEKGTPLSQKDIDKLMWAERREFQNALEKAEKNNNTQSISIALGLLAYSWFRNLNNNLSAYIEIYDSVEERKARKYADEAIKYGDYWGNGNSILLNLAKLDEMRKNASIEKQKAIQRKKALRKEAIQTIQKHNHLKKVYLLLFIGSIIVLGICTIKSLSAMRDTMKFEKWIGTGGLIESFGVIVYMTVYFIRFDMSVELKKYQLSAIITYSVLYTILFVIASHDLGAIIGIPFLFFVVVVGIGFTVCNLAGKFISSFFFSDTKNKDSKSRLHKQREQTR